MYEDDEDFFVYHVPEVSYDTFSRVTPLLDQYGRRVIIKQEQPKVGFQVHKVKGKLGC